MSHQGESQNETVKGDRTLVSKLKDRLRRLDLEKWEEQWRLGRKHNRAREFCGQAIEGQRKAGKDRDWQARKGRGKPLILYLSPYFSPPSFLLEMHLS